MKSEKGSLTLIAFYTLLVFSLYGILLYGRSANTFIKQTNAIEAIQRAYSKDIPNAVQIAKSAGDLGM